MIWWASTFDHVRKEHRFDGPHMVEMQPGFQIRFLHGPGYNTNRSPRRVLHQRVLANEFQKALSECQRPNIVFSSIPTLELAERAVTYGHQTGTPVLVDVRDQWPDLYLTMFPPSIRSLVRVVLFSEYKRATRALRGAKGIVAVSDSYLQWALRYARRSMGSADGVFPLSYPQTDKSHPSIQDKETLGPVRQLRTWVRPVVVTFIGTFGASSDLETVIKAARVLEADPQTRNVSIILAGDGDNGAKLHTMAEGCQNIAFTGWLDQEAVSEVMGLSSVGLAAYGGDALQSLPNKPYEYMSAGLPILSSLRGDLETLIESEQVGRQYIPGDVASLVAAIRWFASNPDQCAEMGRRARRLFDERFSESVVYSGLANHLEHAAGLRNKTTA